MLLFSSKNSLIERRPFETSKMNTFFPSIKSSLLCKNQLWDNSIIKIGEVTSIRRGKNYYRVFFGGEYILKDHTLYWNKITFTGGRKEITFTFIINTIFHCPQFGGDNKLSLPLYWKRGRMCPID
jgi:hypothetical protein